MSSRRLIGAPRSEANDIIEAALSRLSRNWGPQEIAEIEKLAAAGTDAAAVAGYKSLARVLSALFATQGAAWGTKDLIASMAAGLACNDFGSDCIGQAIAPLLLVAAREQGYKLLPRQEHPVVINTKGPSASGKSTLRPLQKKLAGEIGVQWSDFALISPDIWRKQLLDYASLGAAYKYAGAFTSDEVQIVDQKLDRYMAAKYRRGDDVASADRPISLRQLCAGFRRGGQQSADAIWPVGLLVLRDHAAADAGGARLEARPRIRPLQGRRRHLGACGGGVFGNSGRVLYLGAPQRQAHSIRISGQHGASRRAAADRRPSATTKHSTCWTSRQLWTSSAMPASTSMPPPRNICIPTARCSRLREMWIS